MYARVAHTWQSYSIETISGCWATSILAVDEEMNLQPREDCLHVLSLKLDGTFEQRS